MADIFKESFIGHTIYSISGGKIFSYPEEKPGFVLPDRYKPREKSTQIGPRTANDSPRPNPGRSSGSSQSERTLSGENYDGNTEQIDDCNLVTWYGPDDPANPHNWSMLKKSWTTITVMLMTVSVYMGSSIYSPAVLSAMEYFQVSQIVAALGISLFVAGYGIGPLFLSPITEIPQVGRAPPYFVTLALFTILQVPTALVNNFAGFAILRFLAGFIGSPPLATGGATLQDIFCPHKLPYAMGLYGLAAAASPALAPIVSGFAVEANGWRWAFWIMLWVSGGTLLILSFSLPETSADNILYRRAVRLRKLTGNSNLKSQGEIDAANTTKGELLRSTLLRPFTMTFKEPIVLAINIYIGLVYAILYSYFESFPIVFLERYGWTLGVSNLPFLSLMTGAILSYAGFCIWNRLSFERLFFKPGRKLLPEDRLPMAMLGGFMFPICLFWFGWTANRTSWVSPVIASSLFGLGATWMFMPFLTYLPHAYPKYGASVLASNDFFRSMMGAAMPVVANPLFKNLGVDWGNTLLGCLTILFIPIPFALYRYGGLLRNRSPNALHDDQIEVNSEKGDLPRDADVEGGGFTVA